MEKLIFISGRLETGRNMKFEGFIKLTKQEWNVIKNLDNVLTIKEIAEKSKVPLTTVSNIIKRFQTGEMGKVGFGINFRKIGLTHYIALFDPSLYRDLEKLPYIQTIKEVSEKSGEKFLIMFALVPEDHVKEFEEILPKEDFSLIAFERRYWRPSRARLTGYKDSYLVPLVEEFDNVFKQNTIREIRREVEKIELDKYDIFIISHKIENFFVSLRELSRKTNLKVSHQLLSYHYRKHVLKLWEGNIVDLSIGADKIPEWFMILKGEEAEALAKTLIEMPGFKRAYLNENIAVVTANLPYSYKLYLHLLIEKYKVEVSYDLRSTGKSVLTKNPLVYFREGEWIPPKEALETKVPEDVLSLL